MTNVPLWWGLLVLEKAVHLCRQGVYRNSQHMPLDFSMNLKLLLQIKSYLKREERRNKLSQTETQISGSY